MRLLHLSGGVPALLLALLDDHARDGRLALPEAPVGPATRAALGDLLAGLDIDELAVLGALAAARRPLDPAAVEARAQVPAPEALAELARRSAARPGPGGWLLGAGLFREAVRDRLGELEVEPGDPANRRAPLAEAAEALAGGRPEDARAAALIAARHARGAEDARDEGRALRILGEAALFFGVPPSGPDAPAPDPRPVLASATALAHGTGDRETRLRTHALRALADLAHEPETGAARAADRLWSLLDGPPVSVPTRHLLLAAAARVSARLGDRRRAERIGLRLADVAEDPAVLAVLLAVFADLGDAAAGDRTRGRLAAAPGAWARLES